MKRSKTMDKHALYLASVQDPLSEIERISQIFEEIYFQKSFSLREDFCGTFALSCCWVQSDEDRKAIGIDIDEETLSYGKQNYLSNMSADEQDRIQIIKSDSRMVTEPVDIIAAFNFSYCLLHKRSELLDYFKKCHSSLNEQGLLIMDIFGGSDSEIPETQIKEVDNNDQISPFTFEFERKDFNPITRLANYGIHFKYPDHTELTNAFTYHFRAWSITEIRDLLEEAGFSKSIVYWENCDEDGFGNGEFYQSQDEENTINWNAYIVGVK